MFSLLLLLTRLTFANPQVDGIYSKIRPVLSGQHEKIERVVRREKNQTLVLEAMVSFDGDFDTVSSVLSDIPALNTWLLRHFNTHADGTPYFVQVTGLVPSPKREKKLTAWILMDFPFFQKTMEKTTTVETRPDGKAYRVDLTMTSPTEDAISSAGATIYFFKGEGTGQIWAYGEGRARLNNWLVFEALPTGLLLRQSSERISVLVENYQDEEARRRTKSNQIPKEKKEIAPEKK